MTTRTPHEGHESPRRSRAEDGAPKPPEQTPRRAGGRALAAPGAEWPAHPDGRLGGASPCPPPGLGPLRPPWLGTQGRCPFVLGPSEDDMGRGGGQAGLPTAGRASRCGSTLASGFGCAGSSAQATFSGPRPLSAAAQSVREGVTCGGSSPSLDGDVPMTPQGGTWKALREGGLLPFFLLVCCTRCGGPVGVGSFPLRVRPWTALQGGSGDPLCPLAPSNHTPGLRCPPPPPHAHW